MATLPDTYPSLLNVVRRMRPDGTIEANMAELMTRKNVILEDIPWVEGNLPTGHRITSRTGLPSPTWRRLNQGLDPAKSTTAQYDETTGMLEAYSKVDVDAAALGGNPAAYRASEDAAFVEGFAQELSRSVFYESTLINAERIHGLSPRYPSTTGNSASAYVRKLGTVSGVNAQSIWLINWEPGRMYGIFPKGSVAGLQQNDMGIQMTPDSDGRDFRAYMTHFQWKCGLAVQDHRYSARLQWDPDDTTNVPDSGKSLYLALQDLLSVVYDIGPAARFYMNRTSYAKLNAQLASNTANFLEYIQLGNRRVASFMGIPIRITDALIPESAIA